MSDRAPGENEIVEELGRQILDPWWRITSGKLYQIITKDEREDEAEGDDQADQPGVVVPFIPNLSQMTLLENLWYRNVILKARQLGFTTLISILWLDHAMWNANQSVGIIAQTKKTASKIFRGKVRFAYDHMPEVLRLAFPLRQQTAELLVWDHNSSSYEVSTSVRGDTLHRLHISELGAIARDTPLKAAEAVEGSLPAVSPTGIAVIESTAEGMKGEFYDISSRAQRLHEADADLNRADYRFHFFAWHDNPAYRTDPAGVLISALDHEYFDKVETEMKAKLDPAQRAWWVSTRDGWARGRTERMWKQYPSTPAECWQQSTEGVIYAQELTLARLQGRIRKVPFVSNVPVNTFWDIGSRDGCAVWFHQHVGAEHRFLRFIEGWFKGLRHFIVEADRLSDANGGLVWGRHFLPHDAEALRQDVDAAISPLSKLEKLKPSWNFVIVPRVLDLQHGIDQVRDCFASYVFDEEGCKEGLAHIQSYRRKWNKAIGAWMEEPLKDAHTEAADALRQHAQGWTAPAIPAGSIPKRNPRHRRIA